MTKVAAFGKAIQYLLLVCVVIVSPNCNDVSTNEKQVPFKMNKVVYSKWDQVFEKGEIVPFFFDDPDLEIFSIGEDSGTGRFTTIFLKKREKGRFRNRAETSCP